MFLNAALGVVADRDEMIGTLQGMPQEITLRPWMYVKEAVRSDERGD